MSNLKEHTATVIAPIFFEVCKEVAAASDAKAINVNVKQDRFYVKEKGDGAVSMIQRINQILWERREAMKDTKRHPNLGADLVVTGVLRSCSKRDFITKKAKGTPLRQFLELTVAVRPDVRARVGTVEQVKNMSMEQLVEAYGKIRVGVIDIEDYYLHRNCTKSQVLRYSDTPKAVSVAVTKLEAPLATYRITIDKADDAVKKAAAIIEKNRAEDAKRKLAAAKKKEEERKAAKAENEKDKKKEEQMEPATEA
jgi:hypothetical protein